MKRFVATLLLSTCTLLPCLADAKEDVASAAKKLAEAPSYTWTTTSEFSGGNFTPPVITGKTTKDGFAVISSERDGTTTTAVLKGKKGVVKTDDGWKTSEELQAAASGGGQGGGRNRGGQLLRTRLPAEEAARVAEKTKELKSADGVISGDLTDEGAKEFATMGRGRPGGQAPEAKNAKGSVKYWLKEGQITKVQLKVSSTMSRNGEDTEVNRTTTYEIKNVGSTTVEVPEEAKKALGT